MFRQVYNLYLSPKKDLCKRLREILGFVPVNIELYERAFRHKSMFRKNNERLEFLGDAILDSVVSHEIYLHFKHKNEGDLSKLRSKAVSRTRLNKIGKEMKLGELLRYKNHSPSSKPVNLDGNTLEALIGAVYEDKGYAVCYSFVRDKVLDPYIDWKRLDRAIIDFKSLLYNYCQKEGKELGFVLLKEMPGAGHQRFEMAACIDGEQITNAHGSNKKSAEQSASRKALKSLKLIK